MSLKTLLIYCGDRSRNNVYSKFMHTMTYKEINAFLNKKERKWLSNNLHGITCTLNKNGELQIPKIDIINAIEQNGDWD